MSIEIVTSFSPDGYARYGRACVDSITKHWPYPLTVYADAPLAIDGVTVRLTSDIPSWPETRDRLPSTRPDAPTTGHDKWTRKPDSYLWDARRFAVKPFVWLHAAELMGEGLLVWLDADTVTTSPVPADLIPALMGGADVAYLGRGPMHPETGFVVFRVPEALPMLHWCANAYLLGWFVRWSDGWTDCHVLRAGLKAWTTDHWPLSSRDLTSHLRAEWSSRADAFDLSPIGPFVQHRKGSQRKREGMPC